MHKLLLFDIDGTLLVTHGSGRRAIHAALSEVFGRPLLTDGVTFSGRTDPQIMREILVRNGLSEEDTADALEQTLRLYARSLADHLDPDHVTVLPGVRALLDELHADPHVTLGLLTGNLQPTAYLKLRTARLDTYFAFGAFGSDHADRRALPAIAVERARRVTGRTFAGKDVVIIGDTEHDITCGHGIGAFAVGVCTGRYARHELEHLKPDVLLDSLEAADVFRASVLGRALT